MIISPIRTCVPKISLIQISSTDTSFWFAWSINRISMWDPVKGKILMIRTQTWPTVLMAVIRLLLNFSSELIDPINFGARHSVLILGVFVSRKIKSVTHYHYFLQNVSTPFRWHNMWNSTNNKYILTELCTIGSMG